LARLYTDENFPLPVVELLRAFGHDILTASEAGNANLRIPDESVLDFAASNERAVLTRNRRDFIRLHRLQPDHAGIIICTENPNLEQLATLINEVISAEESLKAKLIRVNRPAV
jgi:predicted nuclease of predicted toxin-antitoxin system